MKKKRYFSIISDLVATDLPAEFDLYINSSLLPQKEKFVRIFKKGKQLKKEYLLEFVSKYHQLYVSESQRKYYLRSISKREDLTDLKKAEVAKSIAVDHLRTIFNRQTSSGEQNIFENELVQCKETVEEMIEFVKDKKFKELQKVLGQLSIHDSYTYDHSINVAFYSISFYSFLHLIAQRVSLFQ